MTLLASFAPSTRLSIGSRYGLTKSTTVCTISPDRSAAASPKTGKLREKEVHSQHYKLLPPDAETSALKKPPKHRSLPGIGYVAESIFGLSTNASRAARLGAVYQSNFLAGPAVFITEPGMIVDMSRDPETFRSSGSSRILERMAGADSIMLSDGAQHSSSRGVIASAFSPTLFPFYFDSIRTRVRRTWERAQVKAATDGRAMLDPVFREHYISIIVELTTGLDMDSELAANLRETFARMQLSLFLPPYGPIFASGERARNKLLEILKNILHENLIEKADVIEKLREYGDKLGYLGGKEIANGDVNVMIIAIANSKLRTGTGQDNDPAVVESIVNLMLFLWVAGYATTAATTSCAVFELGLDNNIYERLVAEQDAIVASASEDLDVTYKQVSSQMPLLDSYLSEILRMHPAAALIARKNNVDVEVQGHLIEAGSVIVFDLSAAMRDPDMFPDPNTLVIDRFLKKEGESSPAKILSFGAPGSPHYCIGGALSRVLVKTTLSVLLREYRLKLDPRQSRKYKSIPEETPVSKVVVSGIPSRFSA